jgi:hypothetical protein
VTSQVPVVAATVVVVVVATAVSALCVIVFDGGGGGVGGCCRGVLFSLSCFVLGLSPWLYKDCWNAELEISHTYGAKLSKLKSI